ncbi:MAG: sporulation protein YunB [Bacilli bacterium]
MRKKIHLRKKYTINIIKKVSKKNIFIWTIIAIIAISYLLIKMIGDIAIPPLTKYAKNEANKVTNIVVNRTVEKIVGENLNIEDLYIINKDSNNSINMVDFNTITVNQLLTKIINEIQNNLQNIERGNLDQINIDELGLENYNKANLEKGVIYRIPTGIIFDNTLLSNLGPTIPVKINLIGDISGNVSTKVTNYGINNALLETNINIEINQLVVLPIATKEMKITSSVPIAMKLVQGTVPNYYFNGIDRNSNTITIPTE